MGIRNTAITYGSLVIALHWLTVLTVCGLFTTGNLAAGNSDLFSSGLLRAHAFVGFLTLVLVCFRIGWMMFDRNPKPPEKLSPPRVLAFKTIHYLTYLALIGMALSGIGTWLAGEFSLTTKSAIFGGIVREFPPLMAHRIIAKLLAMLLLLHIGGVLSYQFLKSDVLHRIGITWFKK
ncbi:MAG: cytochrome b/b6 domain-containing protein [Proteobacteria bacterium]|nr:cytochrome b/b6 domain-containing protein [Pseudomonadota bacterium]